MNTEYKISSHAIYRYCERTGINSIVEGAEKLRSNIENAEFISQDKATKCFRLTKVSFLDKYKSWFDDRIGEYLVVVIKNDGYVATVLNTQGYGAKVPNKRIICIKGRRIIQRMVG